MEYKKGDRVLYSRLKFGTVYQDQTSDDVVHLIFDRERNVIQSLRSDLVELVADAQHEAVLSAQINSAAGAAEAEGPGMAAELAKIADELEAAADTVPNAFRLRTTMKEASDRLRGIAKDL